jgi:hypothetical protein
MLATDAARAASAATGRDPQVSDRAGGAIGNGNSTRQHPAPTAVLFPDRDWWRGDVAASPLGVPLDLPTEPGTGSAVIKFSHSSTSDIPDGRPWPPSDSNALWVVVRRANGHALWRLNPACSSPIHCHGLLQFPRGGKMKGSPHDKR